MDSRILDLVARERVSVMAVCLPDGTVHAAALHYSHRNDPFAIIIGTETTTRKAQGLEDGRPAKASVVIGFDENQMVTVQMDGEVRMAIDPEELKQIKAIHYVKHPGAKKYDGEPANCFLIFTPTWWRYSEFNNNIFLENK